MDWNPSDKPIWKRPAIFVGGVTVLLLLGVVFAVFLVPKATTQLDQDLASVSQGDAMQMAAGQWTGADSFHHASGRVTIQTDEASSFLFFEDFEARSGPDVYLYVSTSSDGVWRADEVTKVLVPGGADDGQATLRGSFRVDLPEGVNAASIGSAILWCDQYAVQFGHATFS